MNDFFTQFKNTARTIKLSSDEKQVMRVQLYNYLESNQGFEAASIAAPARSVPSMYYWFAPRYAMPFAALLLVVFSGGTAFAAQGSLPGEALYSIKIHVNEKVATALATTPEAKAKVEATLATNRLEEAETLAANGKLDAAVTAQLASNFEMHASAAQQTSLSLESNDPGTAAQLDAEFDGTLAAHGAILSLLGDDSSNDETVHNSSQLAMQVQSRIRIFDAQGELGNAGNNAAATLAISSDAADVATSAEGSNVRSFSAAAEPQAQPMALSVSNQNQATGSAPAALKAPAPAKINAKATSAALTTAAPADVQKDIQVSSKLGVQASTSLAAATKRFTSMQHSMDANTASLLSAQLADMQLQLVAANESLALGDTTMAKEGFTRVLRFSSKLDAYLKAGKKFNVTLLTSLIDSSRAYNKGKGDTQNNQNQEAVKGEVNGAATINASNSAGSTNKDEPVKMQEHQGSNTATGSVEVNLHL
jgi:hypothetical protein